MEFIKNEMINAVLRHYYDTFSKTLDTGDYVPKKFNDKILKYIYKNMKKKFKQVDREYRKILKQYRLVPNAVDVSVADSAAPADSV